VQQVYLTYDKERIMSTQSALLIIKDLHVDVHGKQILKGINLVVHRSDIHALMGPNGSGKSTLAYVLMGHPAYKITRGSIHFDGQDITHLSPDKRAKKGLFLGFQYPFEVEGVCLRDFLRQSYNALYGGTEKQLGLKAFKDMLEEKMALLAIEPTFIQRHVNVGCSGGEKKRAEILQLAVLAPKLAVLDEIDSGLDIDALTIVCAGIKRVKEDNPDMALLIITHYQRILKHLHPDIVHVVQEGSITVSGNKELAEELEQTGYAMEKK